MTSVVGSDCQVPTDEEEAQNYAGGCATLHTPSTMRILRSATPLSVAGASQLGRTVVRRLSLLHVVRLNDYHALPRPSQKKKGASVCRSHRRPMPPLNYTRYCTMRIRFEFQSMSVNHPYVIVAFQ